MYVNCSLITVIVETCNKYAFPHMFYILVIPQDFTRSNYVAKLLLFIEINYLIINIHSPSILYSLASSGSHQEQILWHNRCICTLWTWLLSSKPHVFFDRSHTFNNFTYPSIYFLVLPHNLTRSKYFDTKGAYVYQLLANYSNNRNL